MAGSWRCGIAGRLLIGGWASAFARWVGAVNNTVK